MFNYISLIKQVRNLLGDLPIRNIEEVPSFQSTSYYIKLSQEGYATIQKNGFLIDDININSNEYSLDKNIIKMNDQIVAGSSIVIDYTTVRYTDDMIKEYIGDTIRNYISPLTNTDYGFGEGTTTNYNITNNEIGLFVHGTVLNIVGINLLEVSGDAIYIRDGDTTIDTRVSSQEAGKSYANIFSKFQALFKTVRINTFRGIVIGG